MDETQHDFTFPAHSIYSLEHRGGLLSSLAFEGKSLIGRMLLGRNPPMLKGGVQLLNLGCGEKGLNDFVNADFFRLRGSKGCPNFWPLDLRYSLKCPGNHWAGVFTEHTLEHLHPERVLALLQELFRTMLPGAWIRIVVPDLAKYVDYYVGRSSDPAFSKWQPRSAALRSVAQNYMHLSLWDAELLADALARAGFIEPTKRTFGQGADTRLLRDTVARAYESLYFEAQKPPHEP